MPEEPQKKWIIETNDRYSKIVTTVISLATGSLVLPALFLREYLGVEKGKPLAPLLNSWAYRGWLCLGLSILCGLLYSWLSVKWVKYAWGQPIVLNAGFLEAVMDVSFAVMLVSFFAGVAASVWFFLSFHV
jgi:hypothetical protein